MTQGLIYPRPLISSSVIPSPPFKLRNPKYHSTETQAGCGFPAVCPITVVPGPMMVAPGTCAMTLVVAAQVILSEDDTQEASVILEQGLFVNGADKPSPKFSCPFPF